MADPASDGQRVLVLAPYGKDAESIAAIVEQRGSPVRVVTGIASLCSEIGDATGVVIITEEALSGELGVLQSTLSQQPAWSDIPFLLLRAVNRRHPGRASHVSLDTMNVVELERPVGIASLMSAVLSALRSRRKQFVIRDQIVALSESKKALAASEAELRLIADALPVLIGFVDHDVRYRFANRTYEQWMGTPVEQIIGKTVEQVIGPDAWRVRKDAVARALAGETVVLELEWPHLDGRRRDAEIRYLPRRAVDGRVDGFHIFATDITARRLALEVSQQQSALLEARVAERTSELQAQIRAREESESALRQAQKMEAVGQLTGGIAHDFNNMLTGILASLDLMRVRLDAEKVDRVDRYLDIATTSALRAAGLTQRLLAFSRRQSLNTAPVDSGKLIAGLSELLSGTLGEQVKLDFDVADGLPCILVDANQLESAILNLAINARDAMPQGGTLKIAVRGTDHRDDDYVPQGATTRVDLSGFVAISVSDSGVGMSQSIIDRIFEPFFTTKPIGQGTGLGMSMIYGFIRQSNGHVRVDSVVGTGTTITLYVPVAVSVPAEDTSIPVTVAADTARQVLVVEDDAQVRALVEDVLIELGYSVRIASDADQAIPMLKSQSQIDLLITDVGLPGLNGRQLAEIARQTRPELGVLFMTGYAETAVNRSEFLDAGMSLITKPFALNDFSTRVHQMLTQGGVTSPDAR